MLHERFISAVPVLCYLCTRALVHNCASVGKALVSRLRRVPPPFALFRSQQRVIDLGLTRQQQLTLHDYDEQHARELAELVQDLQPEDGGNGNEPEPPDPREVERITSRASMIREGLNQPMCPGSCANNALHANFLLFHWRHQYAVGDCAFDALLKMLGNTLPPKGNQLPTSLYMMRKVRTAVRFRAPSPRPLQPATPPPLPCPRGDHKSIVASLGPNI
jgi:hypothetical protein